MQGETTKPAMTARQRELARYCKTGAELDEWKRLCALWNGPQMLTSAQKKAYWDLHLKLVDRETASKLSLTKTTTGQQ